MQQDVLLLTTCPSPLAALGNSSTNLTYPTATFQQCRFMFFYTVVEGLVLAIQANQFLTPKKPGAVVVVVYMCKNVFGYWLYCMSMTKQAS